MIPAPRQLVGGSVTLLNGPALRPLAFRGVGTGMFPLEFDGRNMVSPGHDAELSFHVEMRARELIEQGVPPERARAFARSTRTWRLRISRR